MTRCDDRGGGTDGRAVRPTEGEGSPIVTGREAARLSEAHRRYQAALAAARDLEGRRRVVEEVVPTWWGPLPGDIDFERIDMHGVAAESVRAPGAISGRVLLYVHGGGLTLGSPAIVRTLVAEMEGTFDLGPNPEGRGTRAVVEMSLGQPRR